MNAVTGRPLASLAAGLSLTLALAIPAAAQDAGAAAGAAPAEPVTVDAERVFLDTRVSDVAVDERATIVTMAESSRSPCPSPFYVYQRERPKWLYQTGRFLVALREDADVRISFRCQEGTQVINAMMFLSPPPGMADAQMPTRDQTVAAQTRPPQRERRSSLGRVPLPTDPSPSASGADRMRTVPSP